MCKRIIPKVEYEITVNVLKNMVYFQQQKQYCFFMLYFYFVFIESQTSAGSLYFCCEKGKIQNNTFYTSIYILYIIFGKQKKDKK